MKCVKQYWVYGLMVVIIVLSSSAWWFSQERIPSEIHIAAGVKGGQYYKLMHYLQPHIEKQTDSLVFIHETQGSVENDRLLSAGKVDFAILQMGPVGINNKLLITPLYPEIVQIIVRKDSNINTIADFSGHKITLNALGSGMRASAEKLLKHYGISRDSITTLDTPFPQMAQNSFLDAAIVTSGVMNPEVEELLLTGDFKFVPIVEADGIAQRQAFFNQYTIPMGLYQAGQNAIPKEPIPTISTMAVLVAKKGVSAKLINALLEALYLSDAIYQFPDVFSKDKAYRWQALPKYPVAAAYFNPYEGIDLLASMMESLAAGKELLFALGAAFYVLWDWRNRRKLARVQKQLSLQKERLDNFLEQTIVIERSLLFENGLVTLKKQLDDVTKIKLAALEEFTHEDLRADRAFSIFLMQCANLIMKIQVKINLLGPMQEAQNQDEK